MHEDMKGCFFSEGQLFILVEEANCVLPVIINMVYAVTIIRFRQGSRVTVVGAVKDGIRQRCCRYWGGILNITATDLMVFSVRKVR